MQSTSMDELIDTFLSEAIPNLDNLLQQLSEPMNMKQLIDYILQWQQLKESKRPYQVTELLFASYDALLCLFFSVNIADEPAIMYLLSFLDHEQNETSCGYFERALRPFLMLKSEQMVQYLRFDRLIPMIAFEGIQEVLIYILVCTEFTEEYRISLVHELIQCQSDASFRVISSAPTIMELWALQNPIEAQTIFEYKGESYYQLQMIESLMEYNIHNVSWYCQQIDDMFIIEQQIEEPEVIGTNFLTSSSRLGEYRLKLIRVLSKTIFTKETVRIQDIILTLILRYEWNNQLQQVAVDMYHKIIGSAHEEYLMGMIREFIMNNITFTKQHLNLKTQVSRGYQWVFTQLVMIIKQIPLLEPNSAWETFVEEKVNGIILIEQNYLFNKHPLESSERQSLSILDRLNERISRNRGQQQEINEETIQIQNLIDEQSGTYENFKGRNSFGGQYMEIEEDNKINNNIDKPPIAIEPEINQFDAVLPPYEGIMNLVEMVGNKEQIE